MRLVALGMLAFGAASCAEQLGSKVPLFTEGAETPRPGLWALMDEGCVAPTSSAVHRWPDCASPVWIENGAVTLILASPVRSDFVLSGGSPRVAQLAYIDPKSRTRSFSYYAVEPEGAAPFQRARVRRIACPEAAPGGGETCLAASQAEVRQAAQSSVEPPMLAVFVSDAG